MARIQLFVGGSRSGKSDAALRAGEALPGPRCFVATCPCFDDEMRDRIRRHRKTREGGSWETREEPLDLAGVLASLGTASVVLVDCLALWVNNLLFGATQALTEEDVVARTGEVLQACRALPGTVIFVSAEVGMGIVPGGPLSRRYRDLLGRCNQIVAEAADDVTFLSCGLPLTLKGART